MKGNNNYGYKKTQKQINLVAHDRVLVFENFRYLMESLEEYIEKTGCFPDFKRQFRNITIPKEKEYSIKNCENLFRTKLLIFLGVLSDDTPDDTRKEVKEEFWKWIDGVGIDANQCPDEKLKHFLLEVNNVIEGSSEKVFEQTKERLDNKYKNDLPSWEGVMKVFGSIQNPLDEKRDQEELYRSKNYFEVENESKVEGVKEKGEQIYNQLTGSISSSNFHFFKNDNPQQRSNSEIIQDIKNNPQSWRIDEVITEYNDKSEATKKELALIHNSVEVGFNGAVYNWQQPVYLANRFNQSEISEINQVLGISQTSTSNYHQKNQSVLDKVNNPTTSNSNNNLGTISIIAVILVLASLATYGIVKKSKKVKKVKKNR